MNDKHSRQLEVHRRPINILVPGRGHHETLYPRSSATTYTPHQHRDGQGEEEQYEDELGFDSLLTLTH